MGRRGKPGRGKDDDSEEQEEGEVGAFGSMGFLSSKESMGGSTLPRGNQKGRSAQATEKLCPIQNNEKLCSAQKNVTTERTILESGGHQVSYFFSSVFPYFPYFPTSSSWTAAPPFVISINLAAHLSGAASISTFSASCQLDVCSRSLFHSHFLRKLLLF